MTVCPHCGGRDYMHLPDCPEAANPRRDFGVFSALPATIAIYAVVVAIVWALIEAL
jgi:hypothetical protein